MRSECVHSDAETEAVQEQETKAKREQAASLEKLVASCVKQLKKRGLTIATAESCTGGLLAGKLVDIPGVSEAFQEGYVTYSNKAKRKLLNVRKSTLKKYGAVSKQTAREMAIGAVFEANADISLSVTGIAGPDGGTEEIPVGLVFIACCLNDKVTVKEYHFEGDRAAVRAQAVESALRLLKKTMAESKE